MLATIQRTRPVEPLALGDVEDFSVDGDEDAAVGAGAAAELGELLQVEVLLLHRRQRRLGRGRRDGVCQREQPVRHQVMKANVRLLG